MSDKTEITCDLKLAKEIWPYGWPWPSIPCGTIGNQVLIWSLRDWCMGKGQFSVLVDDQGQVQREWLKAVKASTDCNVSEIAGGTSPRTWENWSQGRPIPLERIMDIYLFLKNS